MNPIVIPNIRNGSFYRAFAGLFVVALGLAFLANGLPGRTQASLDSNANRLHPIPVYPSS